MEILPPVGWIRAHRSIASQTAQTVIGASDTKGEGGHGKERGGQSVGDGRVSAIPLQRCGRGRFQPLTSSKDELWPDGRLGARRWRQRVGDYK